jgi:hypothetical protein
MIHNIIELEQIQYKLLPFCVLGSNRNNYTICEFCKADRTINNNWILKCNKIENGWKNLICPSTGTNITIIEKKVNKGEI